MSGSRMSVELEEIRSFLAQIRPFNEFDEAELAALPAKCTMRYVRRGDTIITAGGANDHVYVVRSGLVDVFDPAGTLLDRRDVGDHFGYSTLLSDKASLYTMSAVEDSLLIAISREVFNDLIKRIPAISRFYGGENARIRAVASNMRSNAASEALRTRLADIMSGPPVTCDVSATIQQAAQVMTDRGVSSILLVDDSGALAGIMTDRDLRRRVLAPGRGSDTPVREVMTANPLTVPPEMLAFEAMLLMAEKGYHHLPIAEAEAGTGAAGTSASSANTDTAATAPIATAKAGKVLGMVVIGDLLRTLHTDPVYATATLSRKESIGDIAEVASNARRVVGRYIERGVGAEEVSQLLTVTADAVARRLLVLAEAQLADEGLGKPPVPYAFVVLGSHGRREMGLASDQDNALVLDDTYDEKAHGQYFARLSEIVCKNLSEVGYPLCPGDMMASNPNWRMTVSGWQQMFHRWVTAPDGDALLHAQTFFDMRCIHGQTALMDQVREAYVPIASNSRRLHAHLAKLAAWREPPLGFFGGLVLEKGGSHAQTLDVKKGGIAAIVQMARLFAVDAGLTQLGTRERLHAAAGAGVVSKQGSADLIDAFDFLSNVQIAHQELLVRVGDEPDNHLNPKELSHLERGHLRDAFSVIRKMQQSLATKYPIRAMS